MSNIYDEKWAETHFQKTNTKKPYRPEPQDDEYENVRGPITLPRNSKDELRKCPKCGYEAILPKANTYTCPECQTELPPNP